MSKKIALVLLVSMVCYLTVQAQKGVRYSMKGYGASAIVVNSRDSADFFRLIFPQDSTDHLFLVNDFYKDGKPKMAGKSTTSNPYIQLQGVNVEFFPNGNKRSERNFEKNRLVGDVMLYFPNGKIYLTGKYNDNDKLIVNECRDSTGKVLATNGDGHYMKYSADFKKIWEQGWISNGLEDGEWHGLLHDSIAYVCTYNYGIIKSGTSTDGKGNEHPFTNIEVDPKYPGGIDAFYEFLMKNVHYPKDAVKNHIQGKVFLTFVINRDGTLSDIKVIRGLGGGCDEEALRVLKLSPPWIPGIQYGMPVRVQYTMPINFTLTRDNY